MSKKQYTRNGVIKLFAKVPERVDFSIYAPVRVQHVFVGGPVTILPQDDLRVDEDGEYWLNGVHLPTRMQVGNGVNKQ